MNQTAYIRTHFFLSNIICVVFPSDREMNNTGGMPSGSLILGLRKGNTVRTGRVRAGSLGRGAGGKLPSGRALGQNNHEYCSGARVCVECRVSTAVLVIIPPFSAGATNLFAD